MGFFQKLKSNMHHAGVKVAIEAPDVVNMSDGAVPVTATVTATDSAVQINGVKAEITASKQESGSGDSPGMMSTYKFAETEDNNVFNLTPGQSKTLQLQVVFNAGGLANQAGALAGIAKAAGALQTAAETMNSSNVDYTLSASAMVEGISFNPSASKRIQIHKPGEFGNKYINTNIKI